MRMPFIIIFLASTLVSQFAFAKPTHCDATFQGKPFAQVTIWSSIDGSGPVDCGYKNPQDKKLTVYHLTNNHAYYAVSGNWKSTMPGYRWCAVENGGQFDSCLFAKQEI